MGSLVCLALRASATKGHPAGASTPADPPKEEQPAPKASESERLARHYSLMAECLGALAKSKSLETSSEAPGAVVPDVSAKEDVPPAPQSEPEISAWLEEAPQSEEASSILAWFSCIFLLAI